MSDVLFYQPHAVLMFYNYISIANLSNSFERIKRLIFLFRIGTIDMITAFFFCGFD
jgi:hypothetical protein